MDVWNYNMRIRTDFIPFTVVVYSNYVAECFTVLGSNPTGLILFWYFELHVRYRRKMVHVRYLSSADERLLRYASGQTERQTDIHANRNTSPAYRVRSKYRSRRSALLLQWAVGKHTLLVFLAWPKAFQRDNADVFTFHHLKTCLTTDLAKWPRKANRAEIYCFTLLHVSIASKQGRTEFRGRHIRKSNFSFFSLRTFPYASLSIATLHTVTNGNVYTLEQFFAVNK